MLFRLFLKSRNSLLSLFFFSFVAWSLPALAANQDPVANPKILIYGDSLSAAYGIPQQQGWAALLKKKLHAEKLDYDIINASISGETTSGGLTRFSSTIQQTKPQIVILELGANDGLRGLPVKEMQQNLNSMIQQSKKSGIKVLLIGMRIPPNYGPKYTEAFSQTYHSLARLHKIPFVPFMLENVAAKPELIQQDGLHPNALGQPIIVENIWSELQKLLKKPGR